jgi:hypothetical protein
MVPPQGPGVAEKVEVADVPLMRQDPVNPFE